MSLHVTVYNRNSLAVVSAAYNIKQLTISYFTQKMFGLMGSTLKFRQVGLVK